MPVLDNLADSDMTGQTGHRNASPKRKPSMLSCWNAAKTKLDALDAGSLAARNTERATAAATKSARRNCELKESQWSKAANTQTLTSRQW